MRTTAVAIASALIFLVMLVPIHAGTAADPEVTDGSADVELENTVPLCVAAIPPTTIPGAGVTVGPCSGIAGFANVDLGFVGAEDADTVTFYIDGPNNGNSYGPSQYRFHFSVDGTEYMAGLAANQQGLIFTAGASPVGVASSAAFTTGTPILMEIVVPRAAIGSPAAGAELADLWVDSFVDPGGEDLVHITDRAPDEGFGRNYVLTQGPSGGSTDTNDTDADGLMDAWEMQYFGNLDQSTGDDPDMDNLTNAAEQQHGTDPTNADTDGDGWSDGDEVLIHGSDPNDPNSVPEESGSNDTDADGLHDAWELEHFGDLNQTGTDDPDGDGCDNECEETAGTDPNDPNSLPDDGTDGGDGGDGSDGNETDDSDNDGLNDTWETEHFGNLTQTGTDDPDGDGCDNLCEQAAGTDPNDSESFPADSDSGDGLDIRQELEDDQDYLIYSAIGLLACTVLIIIALAGRWA